jgi:hypothetical protein
MGIFENQLKIVVGGRSGRQESGIKYEESPSP